MNPRRLSPPPIVVALTVAALQAAACTTGGPQKTTTPPTEPPASEALTLEGEPACKAHVADDGRLTVDGVATDVQLADAPIPIETWPLTATSVLIAPVHDWTRTLPHAPAGVLYRASCGQGSKVSRALEREGADFGNAVLDPTTAQLYFTDRAGVSALSLLDRAVSPITAAPDVPKDCWLYDDAAPRPLVDVVKAMADGGTLVIHRGGPCGFEGDWVAAELHVTPIGVGGQAPTHRPQPIATVAATADGHLWLGDAGRCDEPGVQDPQTEGSVFTSSDGGDTWTRVPVRAPDQRMFTAAAQILADPARPGRLLVRSTICRSAAVRRGGSLFLTEDAGATWQRLPAPADVDGFDAGDGIVAVATGPDRSLDRLTVWTNAGGAYHTDDGGASWRPHDAPGEVPTVVRKVIVDGTTFTATRDGLMRLADDGAKATRVFPVAP